MASTNVRLLRRAPYEGNSLGVVIGVDVGTTFSGVSYAILRPGEVPEVVPVARFSEQNVMGAKIPSIIFYGRDHEIRAIGPQTTLDSVMADAEMEEWIKAEHFKLHLRPPGVQLQTNGFQVGDIPEGMTAEEVMGDYLRYLFNETAEFIKLSHSDGETTWSQVKDKAIFVLGHPNGWKGVPQQRYRTSAVLGGLIPDTTEGHKRVKFVTEGEASALACLSGGLGPASLRPGFRFIIADAGGGTVDVSTFEVTRSSPVELRECAPPDGRFAGSVFVNESARRFLEDKLRDTKYDDDMTMKDIIDNFESKTKREFSGSDGFLRVGERRDRDARLGIAAGFLKISSDVLRSFFEHSVSGLVDASVSQLNSSRSDRAATPIWLVGGFASSPYLLHALQDALKLDGVVVQCPETNLAKAVANGAVLHFLDNSVTSRVCDGNYGIQIRIHYEPLLIHHRERQHLIRQYWHGTYLWPTFSCIVEKNTLVGVHQTFQRPYELKILRENPEDAKNYCTTLLCYDGEPPAPEWYEENREDFREVCELQADLSELCCQSTLKHSRKSKKYYWDINFIVELKFGTTELEALIKWEVNGETKSGPVKIIHKSL